jgi:hypothetical protein
VTRSTARLLLILGFALVMVGGVLVWPLARAMVRYQMAWARVLEVLPMPVEGGKVRFSVIYEFELPAAAKAPHVHVLGWTQADRGFRPVDDPLVEPERAAALERSYLHEGRGRRVFYRLNDPEGTAFMVSEAAVGGGLGYEQGMTMVLAGLACCGLGWLRRRRP